jgi:predicted PurR-regulated permease PerM
MQNEVITNTVKYLLLFVLSAFILYFGRILFIPLSFAFLVSFILYPVCVWLESKKIPRALAIATGLAIITFILVGLFYLLVHQFMAFEKSWPEINDKFGIAVERLHEQIATQLGISRSGQDEWFKQILEKAITAIGSVLFSSGSTLVVGLIIPVYSALILYNRRQLVNLVTGFFPAEKRSQIISVLNKTIVTYYNFIKGMLTVYLVVGLLNSIGLWLLDIPQAFLFGFIASILTFIPYVGIMVASLLPITVAWITKDSIWYPLGVVGVFAFVQYLEANLIFPLAVSYRLKINTLATLIAMFTGGILWGAAGLILFIPFAGMIKLIADEVDPSGPIARFMDNH